LFGGFILLSVYTPKTSIYRSEKHKKELRAIYNEKMKDWPDGYEDIMIETSYGTVHVVACGDKMNPPILLLHAASMGAHSWAENLPALLNKYRVYAIDNIGEGNKSELADVLVFPSDGKELADLYAELTDELGIERSPIIGASNGGFITLIYAYYYPDRVSRIALLQRFLPSPDQYP